MNMNISTPGGPVDSKVNEAGGFFYNPTVLTNMTEEMIPFNEESFGPICPLLKFTTEEEAITTANNTRYNMVCPPLICFQLFYLVCNQYYVELFNWYSI